MTNYITIRMTSNFIEISPLNENKDELFILKNTKKHLFLLTHKKENEASITIKNIYPKIKIKHCIYKIENTDKTIKFFEEISNFPIKIKPKIQYAFVLILSSLFLLFSIHSKNQEQDNNLYLEEIKINNGFHSIKSFTTTKNKDEKIKISQINSLSNSFIIATRSQKHKIFDSDDKEIPGDEIKKCGNWRIISYKNKIGAKMTHLTQIEDYSNSDSNSFTQYFFNDELFYKSESQNICSSFENFSTSPYLKTIKYKLKKG